MPEVIFKSVKKIEEQSEKEKREVKIRIIAVLLFFIVLILIGGLIYSQIEYYPDTFQSWTYLDGVYFAAMTVTTVGYGDLVPITNKGKLFTMFYAFIGIAVVFYALYVVGRFVVNYNIALVKRGRRRIIPRRWKQSRKQKELPIAKSRKKS